MKKFPEWVPEDVVEYYRRESESKERPDEFDRQGIEVLCQAMESETMRKAWEATARRKDKVPPFFLAQVIAMTHLATAGISSVPSPEQIATFRKLTAKVTALSSEIEDAVGHWCDEVMLHYFGVRPDKMVQELADNMEEFTSMVEDHRKWLTDRTGKPGSKNAKRTFVIRLLSERIYEWYGTPLHDTVAATASIILDDYVDSETVRKIVAYPKTRSHYSDT